LNASAVTSFAFDFVVCQGVVAFECSGWATGCPKNACGPCRPIAI
jgi:hypothetical protein